MHLRVYADAVVPYLTLVKSRISQIYYGKSGICTFFIWADFRKPPVSRLRQPAPPPFASMLQNPVRPTQKRHSAVGKSGNQKLRYCMCDQNEIPGTILDLAVFKIVL